MKSHICPRPKNWDDLQVHAEPIVGTFIFQHIIAIVSCALTGITISLSLWLIFKHLRRYTFPSQQRQIIRIIFTPIVFAVFSLLGIIFYSASPYLIPIRDLYKAFCIGAIFLLFSDFVTPNCSTRERFEYFDSLPAPSALYKRRYTSIFLYLIVATIMTMAELVSKSTNTFCDTSLSPHHANLWVSTIGGIAVAIAVTACIRLYGRLEPISEFARHRPLMKLISFKLIVSLNFFQDIAFSIITSYDLIQGTTKITGKDLKYGIPNFLVVIEQVAFAIFFHCAFRSREYHEEHLALRADAKHIQRKTTLAAAAHSFNPYDLFEGIVFALTNLLGGVQKRGILGGRAAGQQYQTVNLQPKLDRSEQQDQASLLHPTPAAAYDRSRSPSPGPASSNYYQTSIGSPRGRHEEYRGAKGDAQCAMGPRDMV